MRIQKRTEESIDQIASFIEYVSRLALSDRVQQRLAGAARIVTQSELAALRAVARHAPLTLGELAQRLRLDRSTVSRLAGRLQELELVRREPDAADKRKAWLEATPAGRGLLVGLDGVTRQYYEVATAQWTRAERAAAGDILARLQDCLLRLEFDADGRAIGLGHAETRSD